MPAPTFAYCQHHVESIFQRALKQVDPYQLVREALRAPECWLPLARKGQTQQEPLPLVLIALGKAAGRMTQAVLDTPGFAITAGVVALPETDPATFAAPIQVFRAGHPLPNHASLQAGRAAREILQARSYADLVLGLISGGGSALLELPLAGIHLEDLLALNKVLLRSGLPIQQVNVVRSALSQTKAGGLARLAAPAKVCSLILSDVIGDPLASIASGPTVLRPDPRGAAVSLLKEAGLWGRIPRAIRKALSRADPRRRPAPRPGNHLLAGNRQLIDGAVMAAQSFGFQTEVLSRQMQGEAREQGARFGRKLVAARSRSASPPAILWGVRPPSRSVERAWAAATRSLCWPPAWPSTGTRGS